MSGSRTGDRYVVMPTYEYTCTKCGHEFEKFQSIADKPLTVCPRSLCALKAWGRGRVKKRISAGAGRIFKGSGFYITDYRSEKYKEAARKETAASKPAAAETKSPPPSSGAKPPKSETKTARTAPKS